MLCLSGTIVNVGVAPSFPRQSNVEFWWQRWESGGCFLTIGDHFPKKLGVRTFWWVLAPNNMVRQDSYEKYREPTEFSGCVMRGVEILDVSKDPVIRCCCLTLLWTYSPSKSLPQLKTALLVVFWKCWRGWTLHMDHLLPPLLLKSRPSWAGFFANSKLPFWISETARRVREVG